MKIKVRVEVTDKNAPTGDTAAEEIEVIADRSTILAIEWHVVCQKLVFRALDKLDAD